VDPSPEPMTLLLDGDAAPLDEALEVMRSENRLVEPRVAPKLDAGAAVVAAPEVSDEEEVLVVVFEETTVDVDRGGTDDAAETLEAFEVEFREEMRFPLELPRSPLSLGASTAAKRSA
jgi:hypothetical protein